MKNIPFGGIYQINKAFYSISLGKIIDEALGIHNSAYYGYQYNEIMLVHLEMKSILFC